MFVFLRNDGMKVKHVLKFYFTAAAADERLDRLILKRATSVGGGRDAYECAERVAELVEKKMALGDFYRFLDGVMRAFSESERGVLREYAFSPREAREGEKAREAHRLAVAFARRIKGCGERFREGIAAMRDFCFW